jgi:hypothetical protein
VKTAHKQNIVICDSEPLHDGWRLSSGALMITVRLTGDDWHLSTFPDLVVVETFLGFILFLQATFVLRQPFSVGSIDSFVSSTSQSEDRKTILKSASSYKRLNWTSDTPCTLSEGENGTHRNTDSTNVACKNKMKPRKVSTTTRSGKVERCQSSPVKRTVIINPGFAGVKYWLALLNTLLWPCRNDLDLSSRESYFELSLLIIY